MSSVSERDTGEPEDGGRSGAGGGAGSGSAPPVLLMSVCTPTEADIIVGRLRSAGIDTYVRHEALSVVYGLTVDGAGQQDIMVRPEDLDDARHAVEQLP
jgi:hypothetical protein